MQLIESQRMQFIELILHDELTRTAKYLEYIDKKLALSIEAFCKASEQKERNKLMDRVRKMNAKKHSLEKHILDLKQKLQFIYA